MLYDRWRAAAQAGGSELALKDFSDGRAWTFAELLAWSDDAVAPAEGLVCPRGMVPEFIFEVLRGWRHGRVVCPLEESDACPNLAAPPKEVVHLKRTSATTGAARFVAFTADQLAADPANIVSTMGLRPDWPNLGVISLAHSYGFSNLALPLLLHGVPLLLVHSPFPEALRKACVSGTAFTLAGVPALWRVWQDARAIFPSVKLAISAGAPLPITLEAEVFRECGIKIHNFLGASECGGIAYDRSEAPREDGAMVGTPLDNVSLSATDGLLEVRSLSVASGYWPEARPELGNGIFRASDLVEFQDDRLFVRGRANDVIHIAGRKVAPEEIERALGKHPAVKECLVLDAPKGEFENQIAAVVVGEKGELESIRHFLGDRLPAWQLPKQWHFVDSLLPNERGKVSRADWRERLTGRKG